MLIDTDAALGAIAEHSRGFADAAGRDLTVPVRSCPGWDVAELVWHLTEVHWFWATIAAERLPAPPDEQRRPARPANEELLDTFRRGADRLVEVLRDADPAATAWTWAPGQQDIGFITRHQVQEAAVHHWDAADATGAPWSVTPLVAADAVDEFLTFSLSTDLDPAEPARPSLDGSFVLRCADVDASWTLSDGKAPGTVAVTAGAGAGLPELAAPAGDLLLWLYQRRDVSPGDVPKDLLDRFQALTFTD